MHKKNIQTSCQQQPILFSQPSFIVKIHIGVQQEVQINLKPDSNIDLVIQECIQKYKLKKQAHAFLKKQISLFMGDSKDNYRCKTQQNVSSYQERKQINRFPLAKKQTNIKDLKIQEFTKNKVTIQKTPKNLQNLSYKKQNSIRLTQKEKSNPKIYLKKKTQSQKQNIQHFLIPIKSPKQTRVLTTTNKAEKFLLIRENSGTKTKNDSVIIKSDQQIFKSSLSFIENDQLFSQSKKIKIKTESSLQNQTRLKQFSLLDLQKQMNEQLIDLKYQKKIKRLQPQLCNLFGSIIRYNPPKISKIDPRYASFQDLSQKMVKGLHNLLSKLKEQQLNSLDFQNFKKLLIKYRGDQLLNSLS